MEQCSTSAFVWVAGVQMTIDCVVIHDACVWSEECVIVWDFSYTTDLSGLCATVLCPDKARWPSIRRWQLCVCCLLVRSWKNKIKYALKETTVLLHSVQRSVCVLSFEVFTGKRLCLADLLTALLQCRFAPVFEAGHSVRIQEDQRVGVKVIAMNYTFTRAPYFRPGRRCRTSCIFHCGKPVTSGYELITSRQIPTAMANNPWVEDASSRPPNRVQVRSSLHTRRRWTIANCELALNQNNDREQNARLTIPVFAAIVCRVLGLSLCGELLGQRI